MLEVMFGAHRSLAKKITYAVEYLQGSCSKPPPDMFDKAEIYFTQLHKLSVADVPRLQLLMDKGLFTEDARHWALLEINSLLLAG